MPLEPDDVTRIRRWIAEYHADRSLHHMALTAFVAAMEQVTEERAVTLIRMAQREG